MRKILAALLLALSVAPALAQAPPPIPALPDTERRTSVTLSASTGPVSVGMQLYGDSTDYGAWIEVWVGGVLKTAVTDYVLTSPTGSLGVIPRPITDAVINFIAPQTGTVQIVGARRPRRAAQLSESGGVSARAFNQLYTDLVASMREVWDKTNDVTGRSILALPGESMTLLPSAANRANKFLGFDGSGNPLVLGAGTGSGNVVGPATSTVGHFATWNNTTGSLLADTPTTPLTLGGAGNGSLIGGTGAASSLTLQSSSAAANASNTDTINFVTSNGLSTSVNTLTNPSGTPWTYFAGKNFFDTYGRYFAIINTPNTGIDATYNCSVPTNIPNQPGTISSNWHWCGTYTNGTGSIKFNNMLAATVYADSTNLDVNAFVGTHIARGAGANGAGVVGLSRIGNTGAEGAGLLGSTTCHTGGVACPNGMALNLIAGGDAVAGSVPNTYIRSFSGAANNSPLFWLDFGNGNAINPLQPTGSAVITDRNSTGLVADFGLDLRKGTYAAVIAASGFTVAAGGVTTLGVQGAGAHVGQINFNGSTSGQGIMQAQAVMGTPTWLQPTNSGTYAVSATAPIVVNAATGNLTFSPTLPTITSYCASGCTSASASGTHTLQASTKTLLLKMCGAGGSGSGSGTAPGAGVTGGNTCWNTAGAACTTPLYQASGGTGGSAGGGTAAGGTVSGSGTADIGIPGGIGSAATCQTSGACLGGQPGNAVWMSPAGVFTVAGGNAGAAGVGYGMGGAGATANQASVQGGAGGGGACLQRRINNPAGTYTFAVGAAQTGGIAGGGTLPAAGGNSTGGRIDIEEYAY